MKELYLVRTIILAGLLLLQLSTFCFHARGAAGEVDLSFDPGSGVNGTVNAVAVQSDGKVIIAGQFTTVKGLARSKVARLNADGSGDSSFNAGTGTGGWEDYAFAVALQADGKVLVSNNGGFSRLNSDGSQDTNFIAGVGLVCGDEGCYNAVYSIAVQADGKVLVGGDFSILNGTNYSTGVARLNANGSLDGSFNPGTGANSIGSVALQSDGKVLIAGNNVTTVNGPVFNGITRLNANGSLDNSFDPGTGPNNGVYCIALQSDGKALIGGGFDTVNGTNRRCIARLNADGSLDGSFNLGAGTDSVVRSIALQSDGKVLIGGDFHTVNGTNRNKLARLHSDGGLDGGFNPAAASGGAYQVNSVVVQSDGKVLIGGNFFGVNGTNRNYVDRLNADGSRDSSFNPGSEVTTSISSLVVQPDGKLLIGGPLTFINGTNRYGSARLNADGSLDSTFISGSFNPDLSVFFNSPFDYVTFTAVAVQSDGKVLVGGVSVHYECLDWDCFAAIYRDDGYFVTRHNRNGSHDASFEPALGNRIYAGSETVRALAVQPDGKVVVGGFFHSIKGTNQAGLARLNVDGSLDHSFNPGTGPGNYQDPVSVVVQSDGKVLIGGSFTVVNGTNRNRIARLNSDGSLDGSFNPGTGANGVVRSIAGLPDGKVLIGGSFTAVNGTNRNGIARLNMDGSLDGSFNPGTGANGVVRSIALQSDGKVLIGGDFSSVNGVVRPHVARLYGDSRPSLTITRSNAFVIVSWPVSGLNFELQAASDLSLPIFWSPVAQPAVTDAGHVSVTIPTTVWSRFFRLESQ